LHIIPPLLAHALIALFAFSAIAGPPPTEQCELILQTTEAMYNCDYVRAYALCDTINTRWPDSPAGPIYRASVLEAEMSDWEDRLSEREFEAQLKEARRRAEAWRSSDGRDAWAHYYLGQVAGTKAIFKSRIGETLDAVFAGLAAKDHFEDALTHDSTLYDAYTGLGAYHFWRSQKTMFLHWIPGVSDERELGIREHILAATRGTYTTDAARHGLLFCYMAEKRFDEAAAIADSLNAEFPANRVFRWARALVAFEAQDWQQVVDAFLEVKRFLPQGERDNGYNRVQVAARLAEAYYNLGRYEDCLTECTRAVRIALNDDTKRKARDLLRAVGELTKKAQSRAGFG
jgi:tetratricopeptide (TPR) repeat protein